MEVVRAFREPHQWWLEYKVDEPPPPCHQGIAFDSIPDMPEKIAEKLALLVHIPVGETMVDVGHRVSDTTWMIYT